MQEDCNRDVASAHNSNRYERLVMAMCFACVVTFKCQCDAAQLTPEFCNGLCVLVYRLIEEIPECYIDNIVI